MSRLIRAAGYAAAAFAFAVTATYPGPSRAGEVQDRPFSFTSVGPAQELAFEPAPLPAAEPPNAQIDEAARPAGSLAELVAAHSSEATADAEHQCLAGAVYFEAKGESLQGQLAVAEVVINRSRSGRFPSSLCGVVKQKGQFSFIRSGRFPSIPRASLAWRKAVAVSRVALDELAEGTVPRAMFFHATYVSPRWRGLTRIATVGNHVFYR